MKTKNIFRMLLVAAALLMGANNVKADDPVALPYSNPNAQNNSYIWIAYGAFNNATAGDKLSVTYNLGGDGNTYAINFNGTTVSVDNSGSTEIVLTEAMYNSINKTNQWNGSAYIQGVNVAITGIVLVTGSGGGNSTQNNAKQYLAFKTSEYCAATWNAETNTFTWGLGGWNSAFTFMEAVGVSGNLSGWKKLHLHVSNWSSNAKVQKLRVQFKSGGRDSNQIKYFDEQPDESGNIDINLENVTWSPCVISNIYDLTIYGLDRNDDTQNASVVVTDAYYVDATTYDTYAITVNAGENGSASVENNITRSAANQTVTITATPNEGYEVAAVSVTGANSSTVSYTSIGNNQYTFVMPTANVTITVTFNEIQTLPSGELYDINMSGYDYRTYVTPYVIDFSRSVGVEGYYAKEVSGNNVVFYQITGTCADGVPLLLKKTDSTPKLWKLTGENASGTTPEPNLLIAGPATASGNNIYVLTYHNGNYVFAETEFQSANVGSERAYLNLNSNNARAYSIKFIKGNTNGISNVEAETFGDGAFYNLRGQRVEHPTKGLYIINGRKVIIK